MGLEFLQPWLVFAGVALLLGAIGVGVWKRRVAAVLFLLAASAFFLAGARPRVTQSEPAVIHALVLDVSASMRSRDLAQFLEEIATETELPTNHSFKRFELSDALRAEGSVRGDETDYRRLGDVFADKAINGEVLFITDGRGEFDALQATMPPPRLILLKAPTPEQPDAAVLDLQAPGMVLPGSLVSINGNIVCDRDGDVPWRVSLNGELAATGMVQMKGGVARSVRAVFQATEPGLSTVVIHIDLPDDREAANDEATVRIIVGGKRRIEYCVRKDIPPESDAALQLLLNDDRNDVRVRHDLPLSHAELENVGVVVINNLSLSASGTTRETLSTLADWVRSGGNLAMIGTDGAFGPGGYRGTTLEEVMPVRFRPDDAPPRRTLLLLDVSQSMGDPLPGGETKLQRLKAAALRFVEALDRDGQGAVVGFREGLVGQIEFQRADNAALTGSIQALEAAGSTHIGSSLRAVVEAVPDKTRVLVISDGDDVEGAGDDLYREVAAKLRTSDIRLDVVLTEDSDKPWLNVLTQAGAERVRNWSVGGDGFDGLLETLDTAMASADSDWIMDGQFKVTGMQANLPRVVRTSLREGPAVTCERKIIDEGSYPVVARRSLMGRTLAICTDSWGGTGMADFWSELIASSKAEFDWLLENANQQNLVLNRLEEGAELVWTGNGDPPAGNLSTDQGDARFDVPGRWLLETYPEGETLSVLNDDRLLQKIPLPTLVPSELRLTGDDHAFFNECEGAGIRVVSGLAAWPPRRFTETDSEPTDITWLPALLAMLFLIGGFATRRR